MDRSSDRTVPVQFCLEVQGIRPAEVQISAGDKTAVTDARRAGDASKLSHAAFQRQRWLLGLDGLEILSIPMQPMMTEQMTNAAEGVDNSLDCEFKALTGIAHGRVLLGF